MTSTATLQPKPKAYSYLRFSSPEQAQGDSFRRQAALAIEYAERHGLDLDEKLTFRDLGVSAFRSRNASQGALRAFVDAVEMEIVPRGSYLLMESLDRLSRDQILPAQALFTLIVSAGVRIVTLTDGRVYAAEMINANPTDLIVSIVSLMRAHDESAIKSRRLSAVWAAKRSRADAVPMTARCPAWLRLDPASRTFALIPDRAAVVRRIFTETLAGVGAASIARRLNEQGVAVFGEGKRAGAMWRRSYIVKIVSSAAAAGTFTPHRIEYAEHRKRRVPLDPIPGYFPAVITLDNFQRVQAMRLGTLNPARGRHASSAVSNLLGGLCRCGLCGSSMTLVTKSQTWRYLVCSKARGGAGCVYRAVRYRAVEDALLANLNAVVADCPAPEATLDDNINRLEAVLDHRREEASGLLDALAASPHSTLIRDRLAEMEASMTALEIERRAAVDMRLSSIGPIVSRRLSDFQASAAAIPMDRRAFNAALRVLTSAAVIHPDQGSLTLEWRHGGTSQLFVFWPEDEVAKA